MDANTGVSASDVKGKYRIRLFGGAGTERTASPERSAAKRGAIIKTFIKHNAMGQRVVKEITNSGHSDYEVYSYDAGGNVLAIYSLKWNTSKYDLRLIELPIYGSSRLGEYKPDIQVPACSTCSTVTSINVTNSVTKTNINTGTNYKAPTVITYTTGNMTRILGKKQYEISNHLGNVLVVVLDRKMPYKLAGNSTVNIDYYLPQVVAHTDYYPYGMAISSEKRSGVSPSTSSYRFGFNGQEKDNEIYGEGNSYTAEFWNYDDRTCRRWNVDPLAHEWQSPYVTFANNPIIYTDPDGLDHTYGSKKAKRRYKKMLKLIGQTQMGGDFLKYFENNPKADLHFRLYTKKDPKDWGETRIELQYDGANGTEWIDFESSQAQNLINDNPGYLDAHKLRINVAINDYHLAFRNFGWSLQTVMHELFAHGIIDYWHIFLFHQGFFTEQDLTNIYNNRVGNGGSIDINSDFQHQMFLEDKNPMGGSPSLYTQASEQLKKVLKNIPEYKNVEHGVYYWYDRSEKLDIFRHKKRSDEFKTRVNKQTTDDPHRRNKRGKSAPKYNY